MGDTAGVESGGKQLCIHGHFYQPPREDPWMDTIFPEGSAAPARHWNERISAECYAPLAWARRTDGQGHGQKIAAGRKHRHQEHPGQNHREQQGLEHGLEHFHQQPPCGLRTALTLPLRYTHSLHLCRPAQQAGLAPPVPAG